MKKSSDQTFMLTTSLVTPASRQKTTACTVQSALTPVRSVECGLCASTPALGSLQRISFLSVQ
jgi:hypothetical protein